MTGFAQRAAKQWHDKKTKRLFGPKARAFVVFSGQTNLWYLKALKPGFRHCFVVIQSGDTWLTVDPLTMCTEVYQQALPKGYPLLQYYMSQGMTVVPTKLREVKGESYHPAPHSCVEVVKRVVGLRKPFVFTPWQLFKHLTGDIEVGND